MKTVQQLTDAQLKQQLTELSALANASGVNGAAVPSEVEAQFVALQAELERRQAKTKR